MGDVWLLAWFGAGLAGAYAFAGAAVIHARRTGRRWYEVELAYQVVGIVVACTYGIAALLVGPWWAFVMTPGFLVVVYTTLHVAHLYLEARAKKAVLARERGA